MDRPNRMFFKDNPYPKGHKITDFLWSGRMDDDRSLWFDFHLQTDNYYAETLNEDEDDTDEDWHSTTVWTNYHKCLLSSTYWGIPNKGVRISEPSQKLDLDAFLQNSLSVDPFPFKETLNLENFGYEDLAFNMYLLGHDSCAGHVLTFSRTSGNTYNLHWTGKIALTYAGSFDFKYDFEAALQDVVFDGFHYPEHWPSEKAATAFKDVLANFETYEFVLLGLESDKKQYKLSKIKK